jgi:hypothetical protein
MPDPDWLKIFAEGGLKLAFEAAGAVIVAVGAFFAVKSQVQLLTAEVASTKEMFGVKFSAQQTLIEGIQTEVQRIAEVMSDQKVAQEQIRNLERRMTNIEKDVRELRHGEGYVLPLGKSPYEVGGND